MKKFLLLLAVVIVSGCSGFRFPSETVIYNASIAAVRSAKDFPASAKLPDIDATDIEIYKNLARVDISFDYINPTGENSTGSYTVWMKRVARSWIVERCSPLQLNL